MTRRAIVQKWILYCLCALVLLAVQDLILVRIRIGGVHPFLLPALAVIPVTLERSGQSLLYALFFGPALRSAGPSGGGSCLRPEPRRAGAADGAAALHRTLPPAGAAVSGCLCAAAASGAGRRWRHPRVRPYSF